MNLYLENELLTEDLALARSFLKRLRGYMLRKTPHHEALWISPCSSIHTFLMKFPIDVLFLDENQVIIKKVQALAPGQVVPPVKGARHVLEGPAKSFSSADIGMKVRFEKGS